MQVRSAALKVDPWILLTGRVGVEQELQVVRVLQVLLLPMTLALQEAWVLPAIRQLPLHRIGPVDLLETPSLEDGSRRPGLFVRWRRLCRPGNRNLNV